MEYSRAVATGLNYLETRYGLEVEPVEAKDGIHFVGKNSKAPIVIFSRSKLDSDDFIVSFRDINSNIVDAEIKFENVNRLRRRITRTQDRILDKYNLKTKYMTADGQFGEEVVILETRTNLPIAKIIVLDPLTCRYSEPLYYPVNINKARKINEKVQKGKKFAVKAGAVALAGLLFFGGRRALAEDRNKEKGALDMSKNTVTEASDLLLYNWSNYAMNEVRLGIQNSEELSDSLYDYLYGTYYVPAIASYYNYQEQLDSPIPREYSLTSEYHGEFRNNAKCLNEELAKLPGLSVLAFENSPYADSLLVDINGDVIEKPVLADGGYTIPNGETRQNVLAGEVYDLDGNLIRANKAGNYEILIPIEAANVNVMLDNTRTIDGVMYISDSRLGINEENSRTK